jgi:hypothetical protein
LLLAHYVNPLPGEDPIKIGEALRCIYCGSSSSPDKRLGVEHAIPEGLGGGLLLEAATCPCGPKLTHAFEGKVINQIFHQLRRQLKIKGKKRKRSPEEMLLPIYEEFMEHHDPARARKVSIDDHPSVLTIPRIRALSILGREQYFPTVEGKPYRLIFGN